MFGFANFLLLALFAAAVFDLIFALARGGGLRGALHGLWNTPHLLFGQQLAEWRLQLGRILFAAGLAAYEISVVFCNSMARQNWAWVQGVMSPVLEWLAFLCFGAKILFGTRYTWRELLAGGALYFIARWVYFNSQNIWWIGIVVARKLCQNGICLVYKRNFWRFLTNIKTEAMLFVRLSDYDRTIRSGAVRRCSASTV